MAPALSLPPRDTSDAAAPDSDHLSLRRALASVDNLSAPMEEDDMGLQNQPSLAKDSQEMEQILVDLGSSDLAQADLLQAIKTLESSGDVLSGGDPDAIFPLSGFDLAETVESEGDATEDKIRLMQARLERRSAFLERRLRILQARAIGKRISEEAAQTLEKCTRAARKDGSGRPIGLKAFLKKVEMTSALQASAASRSVVGPKYYHAGTSKGDACRSASIGIPSGTLPGLQDAAGALRSHLSVVKHELDSDATVSSSGAESNDEAVAYNNPHQQPMAIEKRALWTYQRARASIASRWTWLQAQVQELEYKIRQHKELKRQVREAKGPVEFEGEPVAYEGSLPGAEVPEDAPESQTCARVRPLRRETFKKRKLLQMHNLHLASSKAAKPSDVRCSCRYPVESCPVCTGRASPCSPVPPLSTLPAAARRALADPALHPVLSDAQGMCVTRAVYSDWTVVHCPVCTGRASPCSPVPPLSTLPAAARRALADPALHPVLSDAQDIQPSMHMAALTSRAWFRSLASRSWRGRREAHHRQPPREAFQRPRREPKPPTRLKRGRPPLSRRVRDHRAERMRDNRDDRDDDSAPHHDTRRGRTSTDGRYRRQSYDIDNIVIPQSVAASTRPQILTYKEIVTPKWRVLDIPDVPLNNGVMKSHRRLSIESEDEDVSEAAVAARHSRAECRERGKYLRQSRRQQQQQLDGDPLPPPQPRRPSAIVERRETIRPYTPRHFPLPDDTYHHMLSAMPDGHRLSSPCTTPPRLEEEEMEMEHDGSSTLSPLSPTPFDGDDPDDVEWDPSAEKSDRRKSSFR